MEQVLNASQRNEAFVKFTVFFVLTIAVIIAAVYFNFRVPAEDNRQLRDKLSNHENQQEKFLMAMETSKKLIDSMGKSQQYSALLDKEIANHLIVVKNLADQSNGIYGTMNKEVFSLFYDYSELNKKLLQSKSVIQQVENLRKELNTSETKRREAEGNLAMYIKGTQLGL